MGFWSKKAPPRTVIQMQVQSPITRFNPEWAFTYEAKRLPGPGTQNYAFENLGLVEFTPIGPGVANRQQMNIVQPQPLYQNLTMWMQGVGGLSMGTIYSAPLIDPAQLQDQIYG